MSALRAVGLRIRRGACSFAVLSCVAALASPSVASSQQQLHVFARSGASHVVDGLRLDEDRLRGQVAGQAWSLPVLDLWYVLRSRGGARAAKIADFSFVQLRKGPKLRGRIASAELVEDETLLQFEPVLGKRSALPLRHVQAIRFAKKRFERPAPKKQEAPKGKGAGAAPAAKKKPQGPADEGFALACANPPKNRDLLFVLAGGRIRRVPCKIKGIDAKSVVADRGSVPINKVYGVVLGEISGVEAEEIPSQRRVRMRMGGDRLLVGTLQAMSDKRVSFTLDSGVELEVDWRAIVDVELESERLVYLSALPLEAASRSPAALVRRWPLLRDVGPGGGALAIGRRVYRRGFFVVPPRKMVFKLPRNFDRIEGELGILPSRFGAATVRIEAGGKRIGDPIELRAGAAPHVLRLELGAARNLTLSIDVGPELDSGARVVLGDLRVIAE